MAKNDQKIKKTIISINNEEIKQVAKLANSKNRLEQNLFIAEGLRACTTFAQAGYHIEQLYVTRQEYADTFFEFVGQEKITLVSDIVMKKISQSVTPSGLLGVFAIPKNPSLTELDSGIVLAQITDPGNMGTLIRTAAAMKVKSVVIIEGTDPWSPKVVQASSGCLALVHIFRIDWQTLVTAKKQQHMQLIAMIVSGGSHPETLSFKHSLLVVGNEANGIPDEWISDCDKTMTLPMPGQTESLNAAIAGSIALYLAHSK
jgi:RNA methyltransferase, TrmH family